MAAPVRWQAMVAMATQLATIQMGPVIYGAESVTYFTTPSLVTLSLRGIAQYNQPLAAGNPATQLDAGPVLGVTRSSQSTLRRLLRSGGRAAYESYQRVTVEGYIKAADGKLAGEWIEGLIEDHMAALLVTPTLGGLATLDIEPVDELDTDNGALEPHAYFAQDWRVVVS